MEQTLKNTLLLGCILLFMAIFWIVFEIQKSNALIELAKDPAASIERGTSDAKADYFNGRYRFIDVFTEDKGRYYPGLTFLEATEKYETFESVIPWCGTGFHFEGLALELSEHQHNIHYVTAYNLELKKLIDTEKNI